MQLYQRWYIFALFYFSHSCFKLLSWQLGRVALMHVCWSGNVEIVELLLAHSVVEINHCDKVGNTPTKYNELTIREIKYHCCARL